MERVKEGLAKAGISYVTECMGGNIGGVRIGTMYILEHGSGEGYYFGNLEDSDDRTCTLKEVLELAKYEEEGRTMKERIKEMFDLEFIRKFAEDNINESEWIEEEYGEKRRILVIETLVSGAQGVYIPGLVLELFGQAEGYDLEDPYNYEKNETIYDALMFLEDDINDGLNELLPSSGRYYVGYHEYDGSYCLFYEEYEEPEQV